MRTVVLVLLIIAASFGFVMRTVEYIVVRDRVEEIGGFYRAIGFLTVANSVNPLIPGDVFVGAEILSGSPFIDFEDRRRGLSGILRDMQSTNIFTVMVHVPDIPDGTSDYDVSDRYLIHTVPQVGYPNDTLVFAELMSKDFGVWPMPHIMLNFYVDYVLSGYVEHAVAGQEISFRFLLREDEIELDENNALQPNSTAVDNMSIGGRYLVRGVYKFDERTHTGLVPYEGVNDVDFTMTPLNIGLSGWERTLDGDAVWFIPVPMGESIDIYVSEYEIIKNVVRYSEHTQRMIHLRTTADMSALPLAQGQSPGIWLHEGRLLNNDDYLNANPVATVHRRFAEMRNLEIGDTIAICVPMEQIVLMPLFFDVDGGVGVGTIFVSSPQDIFYEIEVEIVGTFSPWSIVNHPSGDVMSFIFVPDSILPHDFIFLPPPQDWRSLAWMFDESLTSVADNPDFLSHGAFHFVLNDARDEDAFILAYQEILYAFGFNINFVDQGSSAFWASVDSIMQSVIFNMIVFSVVIVLAIALVVFLYLRQRKKDYAVMRALGVPKKRILTQTLLSILCFGLPAAIVGGIGGWVLARSQAERTLSVFEIAEVGIGVDMTIYVSVGWLFVLSAIVMVVLLALTYFGASRIIDRPALEQLQVKD